MKNDIGKTSRAQMDLRLSDIATAASLLTRIPLGNAFVDGNRIAQSAWAFPIIGALIGLAAGILLRCLIWIGLPETIAAAFALGFMVLVTGALHEDAIADCADGLGGGTTKERCLEIMRDSRIGAFGATALVLFLIARWSAIGELAAIAPIAALTLAAAISRMPMVLVMVAMKSARSDGLSSSVGRPALMHAGISLVLSLLLGFAIIGPSAAILFGLVFLAVLPLIYLASQKINGQTGDILGGIQQCSEVAILATLAVLWT